MSHLQHLSTPTTAQEMTERTIVVVNDDDKDQEIDTNTIVQHTPAEQQKVSIIFSFLSSNISSIIYSFRFRNQKI